MASHRNSSNSAPPASGFGNSAPPAGGFGSSAPPAGGFGSSAPPAGGFGSSAPPAGGFGSSAPPAGSKTGVAFNFSTQENCFSGVKTGCVSFGGTGTLGSGGSKTKSFLDSINKLTDPVSIHLDNLLMDVSLPAQTIVEFIVGPSCGIWRPHPYLWKTVTSFVLAVQAKRFDVVKLLLLDHLDDVTEIPGYEVVLDGFVTPLQFACRHGMFEVAQALLARGATIDTTNRSGKTPLFTALRWDSPLECDVRMIQLLLDHGADVTVYDKLHQSPLHYALHCKDLVPIKMLLENGALINAADGEGLTILHHTIMNKNAEQALLLLELGADPAVRNHKLSNCLHIACMMGVFKVAQILLARGVPIHAVNNAGDTALHLALSSQHLSAPVVQLLLQYGADVSLCNNEYMSPLDVACEDGGLEVVKLLLEYGAEIDMTDGQGNTPLRYAYWNKSVAELMTEWGQIVTL